VASVPTRSLTKSVRERSYVRRTRALMRPMWDEWAKKHGAVGKQLLDGAAKACGAT